MTAQPMTDASTQPAHAEAMLGEQAATAAPETANDNAVLPTAADEVLAADTAPEADLAAATEEAARKQEPPIEKAEAIAPAAEALLPPPTTQLPKPKQSTGEMVPIHDAQVENLILLPAVLTNAEKNLAVHIGSVIDPMLEKNLLLNVSNNLEKGTTSLILSFEGDMVAANPAVLSEQVVAALHKVPAMQTLFAEHHHTPISSVHEGKLHVAIPHLTTAQYAHLVQALAAGIEVSHAAPAHPAAEIAAQAQENAAAAMAAHPPATEVADVNHEGIANDNVTERAVG